MSPVRIRCCVPFCERMVKRHVSETEAICSHHWRAIPTKYRMAYHRSYRWCDGEPYRRKGPPAKRFSVVACLRLWERMKKLAIERAMGIA